MMYPVRDTIWPSYCSFSKSVWIPPFNYSPLFTRSLSFVEGSQMLTTPIHDSFVTYYEWHLLGVVFLTRISMSSTSKKRSSLVEGVRLGFSTGRRHDSELGFRELGCGYRGGWWDGNLLVQQDTFVPVLNRLPYLFKSYFSFRCVSALQVDCDKIR